MYGGSESIKSAARNGIMSAKVAQSKRSKRHEKYEISVSAMRVARNGVMASIMTKRSWRIASMAA